MGIKMFQSLNGLLSFLVGTHPLMTSSFEGVGETGGWGEDKKVSGLEIASF